VDRLKSAASIHSGHNRSFFPSDNPPVYIESARTTRPP
jgi:hypothetical protein